MIIGKLNEEVFEDFTVVNYNFDPVTGLNDGDFSRNLYDPDGNDSTNIVIITELSNGNYRASFTPNKLGTWYLVVRNEDYFPWGKADNIQVYEDPFADGEFSELIERILGLTQENYYLDETTYGLACNLTSARIRIYSEPTSVGTDSDVIATYRITATYDDNGNLIDYKVVREL